MQSHEFGSSDENTRAAGGDESSSAASMAMFNGEFYKVLYGDQSTIDTTAETVIVLESNSFKLKADGSALDWHTLKFDGSVMYSIEIPMNGIDDDALPVLAHLLFHFARLQITGVTVEGLETFFKRLIPYVYKLFQ